MQGGGDRTALRARLAPVVDGIVGQLEEANQAREDALKACRSVIRLSGSAIRSVHRRDLDEADAVIDQAEVALRSAQRALRPFPDLTYAGFINEDAFVMQPHDHL